MPCKKLDEVHELIDWIRPEKLLAGVHANRTGEKAWPPSMMIKALLLQSWYRLSDPGLEKQLARDLLFRRLIGFDLSESVADQSTLWRFRQKLEGGSLLERLRPEVNEQLAGQGVYIKSEEVSIVDASVIAAKQSRPKQGKDGQNTQDPEASWSVEVSPDGKRKSTDGYKAHDNVDGAGFIKVTDYSTGSLHDSNCFPGLLITLRRAKPRGACVWYTQATLGDGASPLRGNEPKSNTV